MEKNVKAMVTFDEWAEKEGFPVTSTQRSLWKKCWDTAQANAPVLPRNAACIDACEGVSDARLVEFAELRARGAVGPWDEAVRQAIDREQAALRQRDVLLAALLRLYNAGASPTHSADEDAALDEAKTRLVEMGAKPADEDESE